VLSAPNVPTVVRVAVHALQFLCRPTTVRRLVVAIKVDAVKRLPFRTFTHVSQEIQETPANKGIPAVADGDSTATIMRVRSIAGIAATPEHRNPTLIGGRARHAVGLDSGDVLLHRALGPDDFLSSLCVRSADGGSVVAANEAPGDPFVNGRLSPASTFTEPRVCCLSQGVSSKERGTAVTPAFAVGQAFTASTSAERGRHVAPQVEGGSISKQLIHRDLGPATAFAVHTTYCNRDSEWRKA